MFLVQKVSKKCQIFHCLPTKLKKNRIIDYKFKWYFINIFSNKEDIIEMR